MAKDIPSREGADVYASPVPDKIGPVAANVEPTESTKPVEVATTLATPAAHAEALKAVKTIARSARVNGEPETFQLFHWQHAAAEALHGWKQHEHHEGKPIELSRGDYEAALVAASVPVTRAIGRDGKPTGEPLDSAKAAAEGVPTITDYEPHKPALSSHYSKAV